MAELGQGRPQEPLARLIGLGSSRQHTTVPEGRRGHDVDAIQPAAHLERL